MNSESEFSDESDEHEVHVITLCYKVRKNANDCFTLIEKLAL